MPTSEQPRQHLQPQSETSEEHIAEAEANIEADPLNDLETARQASGLITSSDAAPNASEEEDGFSAEAGEGEEGDGSSAVAEPIVYRDLGPEELQASVEAVLFMNHKPVSLSKLRELIHPEISEDDYRTAISNLMASYFDSTKGIELVEIAGGYQFRTKSDHKDIIRRMYQIAPMKLTNAMLEVLAITAYNQPITREVVDKIRGVDSSHLLRVLLDKKMLRIVGKSDEIGRPMLYATSKEFLELFGLRDLNSLPSLREIEDMLPKNEVGAEISEEEALAQEMSGIVEASKPLEFNDLEVEDLDNYETQTSQEHGERQVPARSHSDRGEESHASSAKGSEAGGDLHLSPEASGHHSPGQESSSES